MNNEYPSKKANSVFSLIYQTLALYKRFILPIFAFVIITAVANPIAWGLIFSEPFPLKVVGSLLLFLSLAFGILSGLVLYNITIQAVQNEEIDWKRAYYKSIDKFWQCLGVYILLNVIFVLSFISLSLPLKIVENFATSAITTFLALFSAIFLGFLGLKVVTNGTLIFPVLLHEGSNIIDSWKRSKKLLKGNYSALFGGFLLFLVIILAIAGFSALILSFLGFGLSFMEFVITYTFMFAGYLFPIFLTLFYFNMRTRKDL